MLVEALPEDTFPCGRGPCCDGDGSRLAEDCGRADAGCFLSEEDFAALCCFVLSVCGLVLDEDRVVPLVEREVPLVECEGRDSLRVCAESVEAEASANATAKTVVVNSFSLISP